MNWLSSLGLDTIGPELFLILVLPVGVGMLLLTLFMGGNERKKFSQRIQRVSGSRTNPKAGIESVSAKRSLAYSSIPLLNRMIKQFLPRPELLRQRLERAGISSPLGIYLLINVLVTALAFTGLYIGRTVSPAAAALIGIFCGLALPHLFTALLIKRRQSRFIANFPEAIDLMTRGIKSGLPITESIKTASEEIPNPVGSELKRVTDGVRLGQKLDESLWEASDRLDIPEFKFFTVALSIQSETGGNLAETLANLADVLRGRRQLKLKVKALSSEAKASAYIIGSLPFVMTVLIYLLNPEYISTLVTDPRGHYMIGAGAFSFALGIGTMYKMVKFEV